MVIHPRYFDRKVPNNSSDFDAYKWNAEGRKNAALYIHNDPRNHPHLQENLDLGLAGPCRQARGRSWSFRRQHLHATYPMTPENQIQIDFRTVHEMTILAHKGRSSSTARAREQRCGTYPQY